MRRNKNHPACPTALYKHHTKSPKTQLHENYSFKKWANPPRFPRKSFPRGTWLTIVLESGSSPQHAPNRHAERDRPPNRPPSLRSRRAQPQMPSNFPVGFLFSSSGLIIPKTRHASIPDPTYRDPIGHEFYANSADPRSSTAVFSHQTIFYKAAKHTTASW